MASTLRVMRPSLLLVLSASVLGASASMLQQGGAAATTADDKGVGSEGAFRSVSQRVEELQSQLASMEISNKREQARRKSEYEEQVVNARRENLQVATMNAHLVQEIQAVQTSAKSLRARASDIRQDVVALQEDWKSLETNFTTALEVTSKVLKGVRELNRAPELRVLEELNEQDRGIGEAEKVNHRFDEILGSHLPHKATRAETMALLQTRLPGGAHSALLAALETGLQDLAAENKKALRALDTKYRAVLKQEADRHAGLMAEQKMLEGKKTDITQLAVRLQTVIEHLQGLHGDSSHQAASIRAYFAQVGSRPLPAKSGAAPAIAATTAAATTTSSSAVPEEAHDDSAGFFELESLLGEPSVSTSPAPPARVSALAVSEPSQPRSRPEQQAPPAMSKKEWLKWFTR